MALLCLSCSGTEGFKQSEQVATIENNSQLEEGNAVVSEDAKQEGISVPSNITGAYLSCQWSDDVLQPNTSLCRLADQEGERVALDDNVAWGVYGDNGSQIPGISAQVQDSSSLWHVSILIPAEVQQENPGAYIQVLYGSQPIDEAKFRVRLDDLTTEPTLVCDDGSVVANGYCVPDTREVALTSDGTVFSNFQVERLGVQLLQDGSSDPMSAIASAAPGDTVTVTFDWAIPSRPETQGCPTCIIFYAYGFMKMDPVTGEIQTYKLGCISAGTRAPGQGSQITTTFTVPEGEAAPGIYFFKKPRTGPVYECADVSLKADLAQEDFGILVVN
ncbi:hypothetical protein [Pseudobacteriovorax antillogorgiicola]|nr:hypothetical protein [Pseudobacteriovorax antillogorgiicola]